MSLSPNTTISHYRIVSKIGAGGMGEVYLAQDTKLDRRVALKILPADVAADQTRMRRFVQEAKAASALNHPNIITIHEIEQIDSINFIATEFIDGETLRQRIGAGIELDGDSRGRNSDSRCPRRRTCGRHHPPRHQAREHNGPARRLH